MSGALAFVSHVIPPGHRSHPTAIVASRVQGFVKPPQGLLEHLIAGRHPDPRQAISLNNNENDRDNI